MKNFDELAEDFALARCDEGRAAAMRALSQLTSETAADHLRKGDITAYQWMIGQTHQAYRRPYVDAVRVQARMERGEL